MNIERLTLNNGLEIVANHMQGVESISVGVWVRTGGRYESKTKSGISHFIEHLLFKGTKKRSGVKIKQAIEGVGGTLNGFTSEELTCFLVKIRQKFLSLALDVLSDMVINATLESQDIEKERLVICEEIKMYQDLPMYFVYELLNQLLWPGHPLSMSLSGTLKTVSRITHKDILEYKSRFYNPKNIVIVVSGAIRMSDLAKKVKNYFFRHPAKKRSSFKKYKLRLDGPNLNILNKETQQTHITLGLHSYHREHPKRFALDLLNVILGANMSSRLFEQIREKRGYAYEIGTRVKKFNDTGCFIIHAGLKHSKTLQAIDIILNQLNKLKKDFVSSYELKRAKEFASGQFLLALEDTLDTMLWIGENVVSRGKVMDPQQVIKNIQKVTREDLHFVTNNLLNRKNLYLSLIGPIKDKQKDKLNEILNCL